MKTRILSGILVLAAVCGAAVPPEADELVRQGNAAFAREDFATAEDCYLQAEEHTHDPGLVAFNQAAALYQLGRYRVAELHYRRCLEDATGARLTGSLYNLGNCLLQQGQGRSVSRLREAMGLYQRCLAHPDIDANLTADARHNLELARLLWLKALASKVGSDESNDQENKDDHPSDGGREQSGAESEMATPDAAGKPGSSPDARGDTSAPAGRTDQAPPPGKGNLPPVPDQDDLVSLSPEDAAAYLKQAASRIVRDRDQYRRRPLPATSPKVMDW